MAITIKEQVDIPNREKIYVETKTVEQTEEFTITRLDNQIARNIRDIESLEALNVVLEAKKVAALAVKEALEVK